MKLPEYKTTVTEIELSEKEVKSTNEAIAECNRELMVVVESSQFAESN